MTTTPTPTPASQPSPAPDATLVIIVRDGKTVAIGERGETLAMWDREPAPDEREALKINPFQIFEQPSPARSDMLEAEREGKCAYPRCACNAKADCPFVPFPTVERAPSGEDMERLLRAGRNLHEHAKILGWPDDGEGALEFVQRAACELGAEDARSATAGNAAPTDAVTRLDVLSLIREHGHRCYVAGVNCAEIDPEYMQEIEGALRSFVATSAGAAPGWISVEDQPVPEKDGFYLVWPYIGRDDQLDAEVRNGKWGVSEYDASFGWQWKPYSGVTHWMPLPAAPSDTSPADQENNHA